MIEQPGMVGRMDGADGGRAVELGLRQRGIAGQQARRAGIVDHDVTDDVPIPDTDHA